MPAPRRRVAVLCVAIAIGFGAGLAAWRLADRTPVAVQVPALTVGAEPTLPRCRTVTLPDADCTAAWERRRRQFFTREHGQ